MHLLNKQLDDQSLIDGIDVESFKTEVELFNATAETMEQGASLRLRIDGLIKQIESKTRAMTKPIKDAIKTFESQSKAFTLPLVEAKQTIDKKILDYQYAENKHRLIKAQIEKEVAEAFGSDALLIAVPMAVKAISSTAGKLQIITYTEYTIAGKNGVAFTYDTIQDGKIKADDLLDDFPREFLKLDYIALNKAIKTDKRRDIKYVKVNERQGLKKGL